MRIRIILLIGALAFVLARDASSQNEDRWKHYEPGTLQSIIKMHQKAMDEDNSSVLLTADSFPSQTKLMYLVKSRPLPAKKKELLEAWKKMWGDQVPADTLEVFQTEVLFKEGSEEHWIAMQKPLLQPLTKETKQGQVINAYVAWMGAIKVDDHWEWLFVMNAFDPP